MDDAVEYIASTHWALLKGKETTLPHVYEWGVGYAIVIVIAVAAGSSDSPIPATIILSVNVLHCNTRKARPLSAHNSGTRGWRPDHVRPRQRTVGRYIFRLLRCNPASAQTPRRTTLNQSLSGDRCPGWYCRYRILSKQIIECEQKLKASMSAGLTLKITFLPWIRISHSPRLSEQLDLMGSQRGYMILVRPYA